MRGKWTQHFDAEEGRMNTIAKMRILPKFDISIIWIAQMFSTSMYIALLR